MDMNRLNLNLLRALHALLIAKNVSIAAHAIGVSQSSMSGFLKQLREILGDELLVPGQYKIMQLTPYACSIQSPVRDILSDIEKVFHHNTKFEPMESRRNFCIAMSDLIAVTLLGPLIQAISEQAPNIKLSVVHPKYLDSLGYFEDKGIDLYIGFFESPPQNLKRQLLLLIMG